MIQENELQRIISLIVYLYVVQHINIKICKVYEKSMLDISEYRS